MKACIVSTGEILAELRRAAPPGTLFFELTRGLGGAWTVIEGGVERIRFGFPDGAGRNRLNPIGRRDSFAALALERIIFARGIDRIGAADVDSRDAVSAGATVHRGVAACFAEPGESPEAFLARLFAAVPR